MKIGIIGLGSMGSAITKGICKNGVKVNFHSPHYNESRKIEGAEYFDSNSKVVENSDLIILTVKPKMYEKVLNEIKDSVKNQIIVSVTSSFGFEKLKNILGAGRFLLMMPNTPAMVSESMTAICPGEGISEEEIKEIKKLFSYFGKVTQIEEEDFLTFEAVCGCLPAFIYVIIEALSDGAVLHGMKRDEAYEYISQTVLGSAKMVLETKTHPGQLKDRVTTPKGSTIVGIKSLENDGLRGILINAIDNIIKSRL
ncbi:pyrroline-5-carboxylate reductase [Peptoniphilus raoultii]|uniref:pyrroline-5-carboxylate reductase n=1 Tax=Peptoniphilus raoultii TaxID=1776387 RepID=UPI0008DA1E56|nr:pyrroline-5-carboxylate reductase [Peptoniphilus raoultii]